MKHIAYSQLRHYWRIYLLVLPTILLVGLFAYFPVVSGVYHAFFRWNGDDISEFVGLANFYDAMNDSVLIKAFGVVLIFIAANLVKMIPSIVTAVVIHRLVSEKAKYIYRVAFVIPMVIPVMVWLLVWKYFYNPDYGVLNSVLKATGGIALLRYMDVAMPALSNILSPVLNKVVSPVFGNVWGLALAGVIILSCLAGVKKLLKSWLALVLIVALALCFYGPWRAIPVCAVCVAFAEFFRKRGFWGGDLVRWTGWGLIVIAVAFVLLAMTWTQPTGAFDSGNPTWLSHPKLVLPALVFWGFPWVGVVSVLLYLSGLNNIDASIYEAADIDGCGWFRKFTNIELPLIMTQVRLNLVLMIIATLKGWGHVFIVLGAAGGPDGAAMLPGLYMFGKAFRDMQAGYACAIGLLLFGLILLLTVVNNKYVRVDK